MAVVFWRVIFWKRSVRMVFYHCYCWVVVVVDRGYGQRVLCAFVLFRFVIPILIWLSGVPVDYRNCGDNMLRGIVAKRVAEGDLN